MLSELKNEATRQSHFFYQEGSDILTKPSLLSTKDSVPKKFELR